MAGRGHGRGAFTRPARGEGSSVQPKKTDIHVFAEHGKRCCGSQPRKTVARPPELRAVFPLPLRLFILGLKCSTGRDVFHQEEIWPPPPRWLQSPPFSEHCLSPSHRVLARWGHPVVVTGACGSSSEAGEHGRRFDGLFRGKRFFELRFVITRQKCLSAYLIRETQDSVKGCSL